MPRRLYLIRHGQTDANILGIIQGKLLDMPLNDTGLKQAELTAEALSEASFHHIYMSPALRARQTAKKIFESHSPLALGEISNNLEEINFGILEGKKVAEINKSHPDLLRIYREKPSQCAFPQGESLIEAKERVGRVINTILINHPENESVLIVSHGGVMSLIFICLFDLDMDSMFHALRHNNCSLSIIEWNNNNMVSYGKPRIICLNDISHLKEEHDLRLKNRL